MSKRHQEGMEWANGEYGKGVGIDVLMRTCRTNMTNDPEFKVGAMRWIIDKIISEKKTRGTKMTKHTQEPWHAHYNEAFFELKGRNSDGDLEHIGDTWASGWGGNKELGEANARRIVACVNACYGMNTYALEKHGLGALGNEFDNLNNQLNQLREALIWAVGHLDKDMPGNELDDVCELIERTKP